jgi:hypothetical protein
MGLWEPEEREEPHWQAALAVLVAIAVVAIWAFALGLVG